MASQRTDRREQIIRATEKLAAERRFHEVTLDDVAAAAHVGKGTLYRYFQNKEDLFFQMARQGMLEQLEATRAIGASDSPVRDKLVRIAEAMSELFQRHHTTFRLLHSPEFARRRPGGREIMKDFHRRLDEVITQVLQEGIDTGALRADLDLEQAICVFRGMVLARNLRKLHAGSDVSLEGLLDLVWNGLGKDARKRRKG